MNDKELQQKFINFLQEKSGAKTQKDLEKYIQNLGEDGLKKAYQEFTDKMTQEQNKKTKKALHGAKLQYVKNLKHICNEDEELVYFKKGGKVGCGCAKKADGGKAPSDSTKNQPSWKQKFYDSKTKQFREPTKEEQKKQAENRKQASQGKGEGTPPNINKGVKKNYNGAKVKAGSNGCVAKFKKRFQYGGSLNGTPFMQQGTPKGGLPTAPKAEDRYKNGKRFQLPYYKEVYTPTNRMTLTQGASIRQYVKPITPYYNDTTYVEIPEHTSFVKLTPRMASTNSKENLNSPILDKNGWPTGYYKFKFNNSPEYETLKRRFNTAWNLAK